jgi:tetratricopeptide (TPR) repeat protein
MDNPIVVEAGSGQRKRGWFSPLTVTAAAVVTVTLIVGGVVFWQHHSQRAKQATQVNDLITQSQVAYNAGDYTNSLNLLHGAAAKATGNKQKSQVYQLEAQAAAGVGKYADAVHYYQLKHQVDPGSANADAYTLGSLYQQLGQNDNALAQYKKALVYANAHHNQYTSDALAIQAAIDSLENKQ